MRRSHTIILFAGLCFALLAGSVCAAPLVMPRDLPSSADKQAQALNRILTDISDQRAEVIAIQRELVARPALNPEDGGQGEEEKARWIESRLVAKNLPPAERFDVPDERVPAKVRPNLIIRYPGASERTLWIVGHMDTSPPGDLAQWTGSPWSLRFEGDILYGRGVEDNHQAITSGLVLLESLRRNNITPPLSLGLVLTSGEKYGFPRRYGIAALLHAKPELFRSGDLIILNDYGNAEGTLVEVAEKGLLWLRIRVTGKQAHGARPHTGINALDAGAGFIVDLRTLHSLFPNENTLFMPPVSSFVVTKPEGSTPAINQVPGEFIFHLDCRLLSPYTADAVQAAVRKLADAAEQRDNTTIAIERLLAIPAVPGTSPDAPIVQALTRAVHAQFGKVVKPEGIGGVTIATELRAKNLPVAVWAKSESMGHSPNERISITAQLDAAKIFARMLFDPEASAATSESQNVDTQNATRKAP